MHHGSAPEGNNGLVKVVMFFKWLPQPAKTIINTKLNTELAIFILVQRMNEYSFSCSPAGTFIAEPVGKIFRAFSKPGKHISSSAK